MTDRRGSALVAALLALALAGAVAAALAEIARLTVVRGRLQGHATRAWFFAEAGLAETVAAMAPGRSFDEDLASPAHARRDGLWAWASRVVDDADDSPDVAATDTNERVTVRVEASGPAPVRRRLEAVVGREHEPFLPGAATLAGGVRELTRDFLLDGRDFSMESGCSAAGRGRTRAGLALAEGARVPAQVMAEEGPASVRRTTVPDLTPLADAPAATPYLAGLLTGTLGDAAAPRLSVVRGDAVAASPVTGAGVLYVDGRLSVRSTLEFTGVIAAAQGIDVEAGASLEVCGALWAAGEPALAVRGGGTIRRSVEAILMASRLAPLPARAHVLGVRELFGGTDG